MHFIVLGACIRTRMHAVLIEHSQEQLQVIVAQPVLLL
jgi:hypothetical protein